MTELACNNTTVPRNSDEMSELSRSTNHRTDCWTLEMKHTLFLLMPLFMLFLSGCNNESTVAEHGDADNVEVLKLTGQVVEASCGECLFGMEGDGCDLAVRIDGKSYYVDGTRIEDHDDAHGEHGMCNCVRHAKVSGEVKNERFVVTSFELLPPEDSAGEAPIDTSDDEKDTHQH